MSNIKLKRLKRLSEIYFETTYVLRCGTTYTYIIKYRQQKVKVQAEPFAFVCDIYKQYALSIRSCNPLLVWLLRGRAEVCK